MTNREFQEELARAIQDLSIKAIKSLPAPREEMLPSPVVDASPSYNPSFDTPLGPLDQSLYRNWKSQYAPTDPGQDYDYQGAFLAGETPMFPSGHWTDEFKKPNHPTFSDESEYAGAYPEDAGQWFGDQFIPAF